MKTLSDFPVTVPDGFTVEHKGDCEMQVRYGVFAHEIGVEPVVLLTLAADEELLFRDWLQQFVDKAVANINAARARYSA